MADTREQELRATHSREDGRCQCDEAEVLRASSEGEEEGDGDEASRELVLVHVQRPSSGSQGAVFRGGAKEPIHSKRVLYERAETEYAVRDGEVFDVGPVRGVFEDEEEGEGEDDGVEEDDYPYYRYGEFSGAEGVRDLWEGKVVVAREWWVRRRERRMGAKEGRKRDS